MKHDLMLEVKAFRNTPLILLSTLLAACTLSTHSTAAVLGSNAPYEAEATSSTLSGTAARLNCANCYGSKEVSRIGGNASNYVIINGVQAAAAGTYKVILNYAVHGTKTLFISVNGGGGVSYSLTGVDALSPKFTKITLRLKAGSNTVKFYNNTSAAPNIDRIVVDNKGTGAFGLLLNGQRDKLLWPFASDALYNTSLGSGAVYQPAGIRNQGSSFDIDVDPIIMTPTAPSTALWNNYHGFDGRNRCTKNNPQWRSVPIPTNFLIPSDFGNSSSAIVLADGRTVAQQQPLARCTVGGYATAQYPYDDVDIYGTDPTGAHGGSGLSGLGGTIRVGEFTSGVIHHPMNINLEAQKYYYCCAPHWPAVQVDGYADPSSYGGTNPNLTPGSLLALLPSFNVNSLTTTPGRILAQGFKDYGAYIVDDTLANSWAIQAEIGPNGSVDDEFTLLYNQNIYTGSGAFYKDMVTIFQALHIVTNSGPNAIGGGGTRRVPLPPAIGN